MYLSFYNNSYKTINLIIFMSLTNYQKQVDDWVQQFTPPYWPPLEMMARLSEETGEVAREINHLYGTKKKKDSEGKVELADELIDVFFTIMCIANEENINLEQAWQRMVNEKMNKRDKDRFERKNEEEGYVDLSDKS
jgi:NTP pyrophosphatase (non-canonical NTP hydrolase)